MPEAVVFRCLNGSPVQNLEKFINLIGGIEKLIGSDDMVLIKPNVQWWNQGAPNLAASETFIELIMERPGGFKGEVVLFENCHRGSKPWEHGGWQNRFERNANLRDINNLNELCKNLKLKYGSKFSVIHLIDIKVGGRRVYHPSEGEGYVYCDGSNGVPLIKCDNEIKGRDYRETIMTYPIFKTSKGTIVDFKNGVWQKGSYTGQPIKFINFSALNHHSTYCGMTSAIKNYMGISDLSGGPDPIENGRLIGNFYNFHSFPFNKWSPGPQPGMLGKAIGTFMSTIRKSDLNITTAEWVGLSSRIDAPVAHTRAILASKDPVALDYHAAKYILYPNSKISFHNPDDPKGPLFHILKRCAEYGGGCLDEEKIEVKSFNFSTPSFLKDGKSIIAGEVYWGKNVKAILKYMFMRWIR